MRYLMASASFPIVLNSIRDNDGLQTHIAQCAMHGVIFGPDAPLPKCPSYTPSPGTDVSSQITPSRAFPTDSRSPTGLALDMSHCAFHILPLLFLFSESRAQHFAHLRGTAVAMLLENQASDLIQSAPYLLNHLQVGIGADSSTSPPTPGPSSPADTADTSNEAATEQDNTSQSVAASADTTTASTVATADSSTPEDNAVGSEAPSVSADGFEKPSTASTATDPDSPADNNTTALEASTSSSAAQSTSSTADPEPPAGATTVSGAAWIGEPTHDQRALKSAVESYVQASERVYFTTSSAAAVQAMTYIDVDTEAAQLAANGGEPSAASLAQNPSAMASQGGKGGIEGSGMAVGGVGGFSGGVPPLTVTNAAASVPRGQVPEEIVEWLQKAVLKAVDSRSKSEGSRNGMQSVIRLDLSNKELKEFTALLEKHGVDVNSMTDESSDSSSNSGEGSGQGQHQEVSLGSGTRSSSMRELQGQGGSSDSSNRQGAMVASAASSLPSELPFGGGSGGGPQARVGTALGGIGGDVGQMIGSHPPEAVTLGAKDHDKAGVLVSLFPAASGDILMSYYGLVVMKCKFPSVRCPSTSAACLFR